MDFPEEIADETASSWAGQSENKGNWRKLMSTAPLVDPVGTTCKCCGQKAGDCVPWVQYEPVFDEGDALVGKKPRGRVCRICLSTYKAAGWDAVYGPINDYMKWAHTTNGRAKHPEFLAKRKQMKTRYASTGTFPRGEAAQAIGQTELKITKSTGSNICKPEREFVTKAAWDETLDGPLDEAKVVTEDFGHGVVVGCWVVRGRTGVYKEQSYTDRNIEESRQVADDSGPFGRERLANKRKAITKVFDEVDAKRNKVTVERPASGLAGVEDASSLLALLQHAASGLGGNPDVKQKAGTETNMDQALDSDGDDDACSGGLSEAEETAGGTSVNEFFQSATDNTGAPIGQGAGSRGNHRQASSSLASGSGGKRQRLGRQPASSLLASSPGSKAVSAQALGQVEKPKPENNSPFVDGRVARSIHSFNQQIAKEVEPAFNALIDLSDERLCAAVTKEQKKQLSDCVGEKLKAGKKLSKTLRSLHDKIKDSKAVDNMPGEMAELKKKATVVEACTNLMSVMTKPPNPSEFLESVALLHEAGATVSTNLHMMEFQQKIQHSLTFGDVTAACEMCLKGSPELAQLSRQSSGTFSFENASRVATSCILDSMLVFLTSGLSKPDQERWDATPMREEISSMVSTLREYANNPLFIAPSIVDQEMEDLVLILDQAADPVKLQDFFDRYDKHQSGGEGCCVELGPLGCFVFAGASGKALVELARADLASSKNDIEASKHAAEAEASGRVIRALKWNPFVADAALNDLDVHVSSFKDFRFFCFYVY